MTKTDEEASAQVHHALTLAMKIYSKLYDTQEEAYQAWLAKGRPSDVSIALDLTEIITESLLPIELPKYKVKLIGDHLRDEINVAENSITVCLIWDLAHDLSHALYPDIEGDTEGDMAD